VAGRMSLSCAVCQRDESEPVVCHHCGQPLCRRCRWRWPDAAFGGRGRLPRAFHCGACLQRYHLQPREVFLVLLSEAGLGTRAVRRWLRGSL
jgi:hypothetical protein